MLLARRLSVLVFVCAVCALIPSVAVASPPVNDTPPTIDVSVASVESTVSVDSPGIWIPNPASFSFQWMICSTADAGSCSDQPGADSWQYHPTLADKGKWLAVRSIATNDLDESASATSALVGPVTYGPGIIDNGIIGMGVREAGSLNVDGPIESHTSGTNIFGLRLLDGQYDSIAPGSPAEGWGFADGANGPAGWSNRDQSDTNVTVDSFIYDATSATSVVTISDEGNPYARVTHHFQPSAASNLLYEIDVTIEPLALSGINQARYRRNVDWDIEPTNFDEIVSTAVGDSPFLTNVSDDGFTSSNPQNALESNNALGEFFSEGPDDIGAAFDFDFGAIPYGQTKQFKIFYGAAPTRSELTSALGLVDVETYSIASNSTAEGISTGGPAIFALGFADVGGEPLINPAAPTTTITSGPPPRTNVTSASIAFTASSPGATFECKFDAGSWSACTSPVDFTDLSNDRHKLLVRSSEGGANEVIPASYVWTVTDEPFRLYWNDTPSWWGSNTDATFSLNADAIDISELQLTCKLDDGDFAPCSDSETLVGLSLADHTFTMRAEKDGVSEEISYSWTISDAVMTRFSATPSGYSNDENPYFSWQNAGPVSDVDCKLDSAAWAPCDSLTEQQVSVSDGAHTFSIRARDAENVQQTPVTSYSWTVDSTPPVITNDLPQIVTSFPHDLHFTTDEELDYLSCRIDSGLWEGCRDGLTLSGLSDGVHTLRVEAEDLAGNDFEDDYVFNVDIGATVATITASPPWTTTSRAASFAFSAAAGSTFECAINGGVFEPCTSPVTYDLLPWDDMSFFAVKATKDGRTQQSPSWYAWRITDRPFDLEWSDTPSLLATDTSTSFAVQANRFDSRLIDFTCSLDDGGFTPCSDSPSVDGLSLGAHKFTVKGTAQGVSEQISYSWRVVDGADLHSALRVKPPSHSPSTSTMFEWDNSGSSFDHAECKLDAESWHSCDGYTYNELTGLTEGSHTFSIRPLDSSDVPGTGDSYSWIVDTTPPVVNIAGVPASFSLPFDLPLTSTDDVATTTCWVDGVSKGDCGWPIKLTYLSLGAHTLKFTATDKAGNESGEQTLSFTVTEPPVPVTPPAPVQPPAPVKPTISFKKLKRGATKIKVTVVCPVAKCTVTGWVKVGKKKYKLKKSGVKTGNKSLTIKFDKKLARATKKAKKGKSSYYLQVSGGGQKTKKTGKF